MASKNNLDPYEALANAIIIQAAEDYRKTMRILKRHPDSTMARAEKNELEEFFQSEWFMTLSNTSGTQILRMLKAEFPEVE